MAVQEALFDEVHPPAELPELPGADLTFVPGLIAAADAARLFDELHATCAWKQDTVHMYGRKLAVPRLTAWYGSRQTRYSYSGIDLEPVGWTAAMAEVKAVVEGAAGMTFNSALANLYRDGQDSVAWHADDETELGRNPVIASVSFGATRTFDLRRTDDHTVRHGIALTPGSLLVMAGATQHHYEHRIAKTKQAIGPRINLTFRHTHPR